MAKIQVYSCLAIQALDIDAIRIDKSIQVTPDALTAWSIHTHGCATQVGKKNFLITGEVTGSDTFGSLYWTWAYVWSASGSSGTFHCHGQLDREGESVLHAK